MKSCQAGMLLLGGLLLLAAPAGAEPFSLTGGQLVPEGRNGLRVGVGFPGIYGAYHIRLSENFELAPRFSFWYGMDTTAPWVGNGLGVELKFRLVHSGNFNLALFFEPEFVLAYHPGVVVGMRIGGPGVLLSYTMQEKFHLIGGMKIPFGFVFHPSFAATIPILFVFGFEFNVTPTLNLFLNAAMGPDIIAVSGGSTTEFRPDIYMGISMLL